MFICFKDHTDINRNQFKHGTHFNWVDKFVNSFHTGKCLFFTDIYSLLFTT